MSTVTSDLLHKSAALTSRLEVILIKLCDKCRLPGLPGACTTDCHTVVSAAIHFFDCNASGVKFVTVKSIAMTA